MHSPTLDRFTQTGRALRLTFLALVAGSGMALNPVAHGAPADDYRELIREAGPLHLSGTGGSLAVEGASALCLALTDKNEVVAAAGACGDASAGGRIVAFAHTSLAFGEANEHFRAGVTRWAARKTQPSVMLFGISAKEWKDGAPGGNLVPWKTQDAAQADVIVVNAHHAAFPEQTEALEAFLQKGGGLIIASTPWALSAKAREAADRLLRLAGLAFLNPGPTNVSISLRPDPPSFLNATAAANALASLDASPSGLPAREQTLACALLEACIASRGIGSGLQDALDRMQKKFGWITMDSQHLLRRKNRPVESMLVRYQDRLLESLPPEKTPAHPCAADFPGPVGEGADVTRTIRFVAKTGPDKLINHGEKTRISTGLYARPGAVVEVRMPEAAAGAGLALEMGIHSDANWSLDTWKRFPRVSRTVPLTRSITSAANAFGGLLSILLPQNCDAGEVVVTIAGAVEAPVFELGKTSVKEWNESIKHAPGAWGYIQTPKWTGYFHREMLRSMDNPEPIARYWQTVIDTADEVLGYSRWRRRGESMLTDRDLYVGYGHAGYPVQMAYDSGAEEDRWALARRGPLQGDWGFLHELGHTFQDSFDSAYTIATHAEVDVNLVPALIKNLVHGVTCWDGKHHSTFDAPNRLADLQKWADMPEAERTWKNACSMKVAYDFYFTLAECLGWDLYRKAFSRWMNWLQQPGSDPALDAVASKDADAKRDRFFLLFCQESGRNLLPYFQKYGLGKGDFPLSKSVLDGIRHLPEWSGNQPISSLQGPAEIRIPRAAIPAQPLAQFRAIDPDPGTVFTYRIVSGNDSGALDLEPRTGQLRLRDRKTLQNTLLTIQVQDNCVPLSTREIQCRVSAL